MPSSFVYVCVCLSVTLKYWRAGTMGLTSIPLQVHWCTKGTWGHNMTTMHYICTNFVFIAQATFLLECGHTHIQNHRRNWSPYLTPRLPPEWKNIATGWYILIMTTKYLITDTIITTIILSLTTGSSAFLHLTVSCSSVTLNSDYYMH